MAKKLSEEWKEKIRVALKGRKRPAEVCKKISLSHIGKKLSKEHKQSLKDNHWSKHGGIIWSKGKTNLKIRGKNNGNWKGGITPKDTAVRNSKEYSDWRTKVFERDNFTCYGCDTRGTVLHAHHMYNFSKYPEYRFEEWNGQTLCKPCHDHLHNELGRGIKYKI